MYEEWNTAAASYTGRLALNIQGRKEAEPVPIEIADAVVETTVWK